MRRRNKKLHIKLMVLYACFAVLSGVFISAFGYYIMYHQAINFYSEKARQGAELGASLVDGDTIDVYASTMETDEAYEQMRLRFNDIKEKLSLRYLYVFLPGEDSFTYLLEAQVASDDPTLIASLGDVYEYTEWEYEHLVPDVEAKRASELGLMSMENDFFGVGVSAWAPVLDSQGNLVAMVEADIELDLLVASIRNSLFLMLAVYIVMTLVMIVSQAVAIRRMVTMPLQKLTRRTLEFASRRTLSAYADDIHTGDELQALSEAFGEMARDITTYADEKAGLSAAQERLATELKVASDIQQSMLPEDLPDFPGKKYMDVQGEFRGSKQIGGNFYDYFLLDSHRVGVVLCGMQERGIPAAMMLVVVRTIIKQQFSSDRGLSDTMSEINRQVFQTAAGKRAVAAFVGVLDTDDGQFSYINAGHNPPVLMRQGDRYDFLTGPAYTPLGVSENVTYRELTMGLRQGDRLLFYSNGVVDARSPSGESFGAERLRGRLNESRNRDLDLDAMNRDIIDMLDTFTAGADVEEDLILLSLSYLRGNKELAQIVLSPDMSQAQYLQSFLKEQLSANQVTGKDYARILVCAEELFSICCKYALGGQLTAECAFPAPKKLVLRFDLPLRVQNPLLQNTNTAVKDAVLFIQKFADSLEVLEENRGTALVMTVDLGRREAASQQREALEACS